MTTIKTPGNGTYPKPQGSHSGHGFLVILLLITWCIIGAGFYGITSGMIGAGGDDTTKTKLTALEAQVNSVDTRLKTLEKKLHDASQALSPSAQAPSQATPETPDTAEAPNTPEAAAKVEESKKVEDAKKLETAPSAPTASPTPPTSPVAPQGAAPIPGGPSNPATSTAPESLLKEPALELPKTDGKTDSKTESKKPLDKTSYEQTGTMEKKSYL